MKLTDAIMIACEMHEGQVDKSVETYILHPLRVMLSMEAEQDRIVAVLHDVAEDNEYGWQRIHDANPSDAILDAIDSLTRRDDENYVDFISRARLNPIARRVKLADIEDNLLPSRSSGLSQKLRSRYEKARRALSDAAEGGQ